MNPRGYGDGSPADEEEAMETMNRELGNLEQRAINRRVRHLREQRRRREASPDGPVADHTREV